MRIINNKKFIIAFLSVLLLSIVCFSGISLMFADEENGAFEGEEVKVLKADAATNDFKTIIDYIIDNSRDPDSSDQIYHVLEIHSGDNPSKLQDIVNGINGTNKIFEELVIDGNKSAAQTNDINKPDYVEYTHYKFDYDLANSSQALVAAIAKADLIYLSEDPNALWDKDDGIDISNEVKEALATFATGQYPKPLIIDSHNLTQKGNVSSLKYIKDVVSQYYAVEGKNYNTFPWPHNKDMESFMNPANSTSNYKPVNGDTQKAGDPNYPDFGWNKVTYTEVLDASGATSTNASKDHEEYIARVLTIHNSAVSADDSLLTDQLKACCDGDYSFTYTDAENTPKNKTVTAKGTFTPDGEIKLLKEDSDLYKYGYYGRLARPDAIKFESLDLNNDADMTALVTLDFTQYDFVIYEPTTKDVDVSVKANLISSLVNVMRNGVHILYDSTLDSGSGGNGGNNSSLNAPGVKYVYDKVANANDTPKFDSVLVTTRKNMEIFAGATTPDVVKPIADIINAGCFRTYSGHSSGDSSNMYTVLEIEPCYPIDTTLASALNNSKELSYTQYIGTTPYSKKYKEGSDAENVLSSTYPNTFYYINTGSVIGLDSDVTSDMISYDGTTSLTSLLENPTALAGSMDTSEEMNSVVDYYKWAISRAKIAHATGRSYDQINVVHMSATEFAANRRSLLDNYDAIYIGGDNSAIKDINLWYTVSTIHGDAYNMYFHNGDTYPYSASDNDKTGDYGVLAGNDLTESKLKELKEYAAKMPVIVDNRVSAAFLKIKNSQAQTELDPDSRMFTFLDYIAEASSAGVTAKSGFANTVVMNFDPNYTYKAQNNNNEYGQTYGGYATVFHGAADEPTDAYNLNAAKTAYDASKVGEDKLTNVLKTARPRIAVSTPYKVYSEYDDTTWIHPDDIKTEGLKWNVETDIACKYNVYVDDNSNGKFDSDEIVTNTTKFEKKGTLTWKPNSDYYGVVYFKVEAIAQNGLKTSYVNVFKIKRTDQSKMYVNLLQVMPVAGEEKYPAASQKEESLRTLFFCPDCQFAKSNLRANRFTPTTIIYDKVMGGENTFQNSAPNYLSSTNTVVNAIKQFDSSYTYTGTKLGTHTHDFGIVEYKTDLVLGSNDANHTGVDDITSNLFDILRDDYDVDMTVMYTDEFQDKVKAVNDHFKGMSATEVKAAIEGSATSYKEQSNYYNKLYLAIRALVDGKVEGYKDKTFVTYSGGTVTVNFTLLDDTFKFGSQGFTDVMAAKGISRNVLQKYAEASYKMDDYLNGQDIAKIKSGDASYTGDPDNFAVDAGDTRDHFDDLVDEVTNPQIPRSMRKYYDLFSITGDVDNAVSNKKIPQKYVDLYQDWRDANILKNFFFQKYQDNLWYASYDVKDGMVDLYKVYNCIALGAAESFGKNDINQTGCKALLKYIDQDGNTILFHDSLCSDKNSTSTMTQMLSTAFGMNARNCQPDLSNVTYSIKLYMHTSANQMQYYAAGIRTVEIPCDAEEVTLSYSWNSNTPFTVNVNRTNTTGNDHTIRVNFNGDIGLYVSVNEASYTDGQDVAANGVLNLNSSDGQPSYQSVFTPDSTYYISPIKSGLSISERMLSMKGVYIRYDKGNFGNADQKLMYKHASFHSKAEEKGRNNTRLGSANHHMRNMILSSAETDGECCDKARQNNQGIITLYPFTIGKNLQVGATTPGGYALDIESDDVVVYYSLVGGTRSTSSTLFAADPMDGQNNYFLYQNGAITYTGAGHGLLTGFGRENNDERKLFINCILNAGKKSARGPSVTLHDLDTTLDKVNDGTANKEVIPFAGEDCDYYIEIEDLDDFKGFDFLPHIPTGGQLGHVTVYWDVNHTEDYEDDGIYTCDTGIDTVIFDSDRDTDNDVAENVLKALKDSTVLDNKIKLMDDYFDVKQNKNYAYIVVQIEDNHNPSQKASTSLRIQFKQSLIDLN